LRTNGLSERMVPNEELAILREVELEIDARELPSGMSDKARQSRSESLRLPLLTSSLSLC
jgi:hypothetical protein